jgi:hypothetical protein
MAPEEENVVSLILTVILLPEIMIQEVTGGVELKWISGGMNTQSAIRDLIWNIYTY